MIEVRDDGRGIDNASSDFGETHVGMRIMRERAASVGARLKIFSVPGAGTSVELTLPPLSASVEQPSQAAAEQEASSG